MAQMTKAVYLDCNASTPLEPEVGEVVLHYLYDEYGNAGSRTHEFGNNAKKAVEEARRQISVVVGASSDEVIFTSGATESNNLAIFGLTRGAAGEQRRHIVTTAIEHKAVLEPVERLSHDGFEVTVVQPDRDGVVPSKALLEAVRADTLLVSMMHANNETGVLQPIQEVAEGLNADGPYFHVDAAQGFGKELDALRSPRIDLISISGHKIFAPKGIGALVARRRRGRLPLAPLTYGGGQERGLRPGTLPVHLIVGLGKAAEIAVRDHVVRQKRCLEIRRNLLEALLPLKIQIHGDHQRALPHVINFSIPGVDSEAAMIAWKGVAAVSNGSACTSNSYSASHVLEAMQLDEEAIDGALRLSWCHLTPDFDFRLLVQRLSGLL